MATDDKNNDKEQDDFFGDDEDFGLPELDYEALDDDDDSDQVDEPKKEAEAEKVEEESPKAEATDDESEMDAVFEGESMDMDEEEIPDQISDEELEASLEGEDLGDLGDMADLGDMEDLDDEDLGDMDMDDMPEPDDSDIEEKKEEETVEDFYEEESFDDFEASDDSDDGEEIPDSVFDSDVLDEDEFAQFEKELMDSEEEQTADVPKFESSQASSSSTESKSKFVKVVVFGILIFASLGTVFLLWYQSNGGEEEQPVAEKVERPVENKPVEKPAEEATTENNTASENQPETKPAETQPKSTPADTRPAATQPKPAPQSNPGTVNALSARTGNFYIVIGSFLDGDMAVDYANELAGQGKSPSIIPPFGNAITHRVAISGYASLAEAQRSVNGLKADYGQDIWILKY
ncbi:SPOR domain-containing protein [Ekhidna sp.]|uniref:SPOR domain-containing protein n=1 Tax=Ekhidna sp. TaxID=2608089 RepID=UPI003BAC2BA9